MRFHALTSIFSVSVYPVPVSKVGLVLGGGGVTGAAYEMAALMAIELATGWNPDQARVIVGTSAGSFVSGVIRSGRLSLDRMVEDDESRDDVADRLKENLYTNGKLRGLGRWARHGLGPGIIKPGVRLVLGSPGRFSSVGIGSWAHEQIGDFVDTWPEKPTVITAYELGANRRVAFGTTSAPEVTLRDAIAASSAVPVIFSPHKIGNTEYVDGGVISGTHLDLVLGAAEALDLVIVLAPMAAERPRRGARAYESLFDRVGKAALDEEMRIVSEAWPDADVVILRPEPEVLAVMRPNVMKAEAAVPTFVRTFGSMRTKLARAETWAILEEHLVTRAATL